MSYALYAPHLAPLGAAAPLTASQTATLAAGQAALRAAPCYSAELDACVNSKTPTAYPHCAEIQAAFAVSVDEMNRISDPMPYCPQSPSVFGYIAAGAFGLAAGLFLGAVL